MADSNTQIANLEPQPLVAPPQIKFKVHKYGQAAANAELGLMNKSTEDNASIAEDDQEELMSFVLTEDVFVEILAVRLQVNIPRMTKHRTVRL